MAKMDKPSNGQDVVVQTKDLNNTHEDLNLRNFQFKRILNDNKEIKFVAIEGYFSGRSEPAILLLEKEAFQEACLRNISIDNIDETFRNDIYYSGVYYPKVDLTGIKLTLIYPATEKHIAKYEQQFVHIIEETPELYHSLTLPFLKSEQFSLQWVFNILEHKSETDRIFFEDTDPEIGFILCSDLKWDGKSVESLYLLALPFKKNIMSLRDLTQEHLPLLRNIYNKGVEAVEKKFLIPRTQLRVYVHYQPSFYYFHVHFTYLQYTPPGSGTEKAHLLTTIINNLEMLSNYYQIANLSFTVRESENLFAQYETNGLVKRKNK